MPAPGLAPGQRAHKPPRRLPEAVVLFDCLCQPRLIDTNLRGFQDRLWKPFLLNLLEAGPSKGGRRGAGTQPFLTTPNSEHELLLHLLDFS